MTGYFARLASRTGIGAASPTSQRDTSPPLETEDVVTFVSQPETSHAMAATSAEPATAPQPTLSEPTGPLAATSPPARFAMPDVPDTTRTAEPEPRPTSESRGIDELQDPVSTPRISELEPPAEARFAMAERPRPEPAGAVETETRVIQSAIAASAAPADAQPPAAGPTPQQGPLFEAVPPQRTERATAVQPTIVEQVVEAPAASPAGALPKVQTVQEQRRFVAPHEVAPSQPANGRALPRPQAAPSVRIGSIQVDVHAAPALPPPQPQPASPAPPPPRPLSLRRFYLRDW